MSKALQWEGDPPSGLVELRRSQCAHMLDAAAPSSSLFGALLSERLEEDIELELHRSACKVKEFDEALDWL